MMHNCCASGIIGRNVDIGAGTISATWSFDNRVKDMDCEGWKEVPPYHGNLSYVGDFCRTGVGVLLMPGVRIGSYSCLAPGTIINTDILMFLQIHLFCVSKNKIFRDGERKNTIAINKLLNEIPETTH